MKNTAKKEEGFEKALNDVATRQVETTNTQEIPSSIYQFTYYIGMQGILGSKKLWLSDIFKMNDPSELSFGFRIVAQAVHTLPRREDQNFKQFVSLMQEFVLHQSFRHAADYVAVWFSKDPKELDQWRSYGDNRREFSLGFDGKILDEFFISGGTSSVPGSTYHVQYDEGQLESTIHELFALADSILQNNEVDIVEIMNALISNIVLVLLMFKHSAYRREGEVRFMQKYGKHSVHLWKTFCSSQFFLSY